MEKKREVVVKVSHPEKELERVFTNPKTNDIIDWLFSVSQSLPKRDKVMRVRRWINVGISDRVETTHKNSGHLYGLAIYIIQQ